MIREATENDVTEIVVLGEALRAEQYDGVVTSNLDKMREITTQLIEADHGLVLVDDRGGTLVGIIGAFVYDHPISGDRTAVEVFWYVAPAFRGAGVRLLKRLEAWARAAGAVVLQMIAPTAEVGRMYERMGFTALETTFQKGL